MKAVRVHDYGLSNQLKYENVSEPVIKEDEVLVKVYATSVNHLEIKKASGAMKEMMPLEFPWIPGYDFAGVIENAGLNATPFKKGDKVYGNCNGGSYAEYVAVNISTVALKPENLTFVEAASVPHVGETAYQAIHIHGQLKAGQKVLIHGAAGGVGAYAVQFAHAIGAEVYATASFKDEEYLKCLGADVVIDYKATDFTTVVKDMDLVLVLVGGNIQEKSYSVLKRGGRLVSTTGPILEGEAMKYHVTGISMVIRQSGDDLRAITHLIENNKVKTDIAIIYPLSGAADGWKVLSGEDPSLPGISHGKIVLEVVKEFENPKIP